jgi:hypothetical protein
LTNNVTFITLPDRIELWKNAVLHYFGVKKNTLLKDGTVVKIICDCGDVEQILSSPQSQIILTTVPSFKRVFFFTPK